MVQRAGYTGSTTARMMTTISGFSIIAPQKDGRKREGEPEGSLAPLPPS